ncbi:MAG: D-alanine--D-alanine ligase [Bacteroidota bacterium]|nr:D-alanine--D-alanine ligase [Bacteroidota bacterium]
MSILRFKLHKMLHWEYWPMQLVYFPLYPIWLFFAFRTKAFFFFNTANPSIKYGGMAMESKKEVYDLIPSCYIPTTLFFRKDTPVSKILSDAAAHYIHFPFIVKPDIGMKGLAVQIIQNQEDLSTYISKLEEDFLVQAIVTYPNEVGIFYCRIPGASRGRVTGMVRKNFLTITGNGKDTMLALIKKNARSYFQLKPLTKMYGAQLNNILAKGESFILIPYGSHTRGAEFIDETELLNKQLLTVIDTLCKKIDGFYYGRLDIRYASWDDLCAGKNFTIIELNGAGSEPTHIYDPAHSLFFAWKEISKHWKLLYKISKINNSKGYAYLSFKEGKHLFAANSIKEKKLKAFHVR